MKLYCTCGDEMQPGEYDPDIPGLEFHCLGCDVHVFYDRPLVTIREAYDQGYIDGITCFAWHGKEGLEVGTSGLSLKKAIEKRFENYNYKTPKKGEI